MIAQEVVAHLAVDDDYIERETFAIILGRTGTGKSMMCNSLLGLEMHDVGAGNYSNTIAPQQSTICHRVGKLMSKVHLFDTPGLFDARDPRTGEPTRTNEEIIADVCRYLLRYGSSISKIYITVRKDIIGKEMIETINNIFASFTEKVKSSDLIDIIFTSEGEMSAEKKSEFVESLRANNELKDCMKCVEDRIHFLRVNEKNVLTGLEDIRTDLLQRSTRDSLHKSECFKAFSSVEMMLMDPLVKGVLSKAEISNQDYVDLVFKLMAGINREVIKGVASKVAETSCVIN
jgi:energy-coupling factor transporter ATP-binding protein EcfA2